MAKRYLLILLKYEPDRYVDLAKVEPIFDQNAADWIRWNAKTWIAWTDKSVEHWYNLLLPFITQKDGLLILGFNPTGERHGWAPDWVWQWLDKPRF